jgi:hypothetical protein
MRVLGQDTKSQSHPDDQTLERYALNGGRGKDTAAIEQHLLLCAPCRNRVDSNRRFIQAMRVAATELVAVPLNCTHVTADGAIHLFVRPADGGGWMATIEPIHPFDTVEEANAFLLRSFGLTYPEHLCNECGDGRPRR